MTPVLRIERSVLTHPVLRRGGLLLAMFAVFTVMAACGDSDDGSAASATTSATATQASATGSTATTEATAEAAPVTWEVQHELGATTITGIPERVVVLEYSFADNLGTLGIVPVGWAVDAPPDYIYAYTEDVGTVPVGTRAEPDLEAIVGLNPDLIIGDLQRHEQIYSTLSGIAPTLIFNSLRGSYQDQLDTFEVIAQVFDREDEAAALLDAYQVTFNEAAAQTSTDAGAFMIGVLHAGGFTAHSNQSFMGSFLEELGRTNALSPRDGETQYLLGLEGMATVNPGAIVVLCTADVQSLLDDLTSEPVWQAFEATRNDRVYVVDNNLWSKGRGLLAYELILADAVDSGLLSDAPSTRTSCG